MRESCSHAFFLHCPSSCPSSSATMGKICFCHDILLITDNDSAIQMTNAHPLACNCKPGWVSSDAKLQTTHPLACNCETGWILFFEATNDDDDDEPTWLVVVICLRLHPRQRRKPTPSLANASGGRYIN